VIFLRPGCGKPSDGTRRLQWVVLLSSESRFCRYQIWSSFGKVKQVRLSSTMKRVHKWNKELSGERSPGQDGRFRLGCVKDHTTIKVWKLSRLAILFQCKSPLMWLFVSSSPLFPTNDCSRKRTGKILGHAGSRRFREDETDQSFGEIVGSFFSLYSSNILRLDSTNGRRKGVPKRFERES